MANICQVPLRAQNEVFDIDLGNSSFRMRLYWNKVMGAWIFDLMDSDGNPITQHQPLVTGVNILDQFNYKELGGIFVVYKDMPDKTNLGSVNNLYWITLQE